VVGGFCETRSKRFDGVGAAIRCDAMRRDVPTAAGTYAEMTNRGTWRGARALVGARFAAAIARLCCVYWRFEHLSNKEWFCLGNRFCF
jgi:hypothetical protein